LGRELGSLPDDLGDSGLHGLLNFVVSTPTINKNSRYSAILIVQGGGSLFNWLAESTRR
jgi:hypothetical protein